MKSLLATLVAWGPLGLFLFAIVDGAGLPTPAGLDAFFLVLAANRPEDAYYLALLTLAGSLTGCMILYYLARKGGEAKLAKYRQRPFFVRLERWFQHYGLVTLYIPALVPIIPLPLKFFVVCAGVFEVSPTAYFLTLLAARLPRYLALAYLGQKLGKESYPWLRSHLWSLLGIAGTLFVLFYLVIVVMDWRRRRARIPVTVPE